MFTINKSIFFFLALAKATSAFVSPSNFARFSPSELFSTQEYVDAQYSIDTEILDSKTYPAASPPPAFGEASLVEAQKHAPPIFDSRLDDFRKVGPVATWGPIVPTANNTFSHSDLTGDPRVSPFKDSPYAGFRGSEMRFRSGGGGHAGASPFGDRFSAFKNVGPSSTWGESKALGGSKADTSGFRSRVASFKQMGPSVTWGLATLPQATTTTGTPARFTFGSYPGSEPRPAGAPALANNTFLPDLTADPRSSPFRNNPYPSFAGPETRWVSAPPKARSVVTEEPVTAAPSTAASLPPAPVQTAMPASPMFASSSTAAAYSKPKSYAPSGASWKSTTPKANSTYLGGLSSSSSTSSGRSSSPMMAGSSSKAKPASYSPKASWKSAAPKTNSTYLGSLAGGGGWATETLDTTAYPVAPVAPAPAAPPAPAPAPAPVVVGSSSMMASSTSSRQTKPASYAPKASWKSATPKTNSTYLGSLVGAGA